MTTPTTGRRGPDPKFADAEWSTRFLAMVQIGLPPYLAAEACGVNRQTYFIWARKGGHPDFAESADWINPDDGDPLYVEFVQKLLETEAGSVHQVVATVHQKAESDPEFGLKWLRHRHPEHWNPTRNVQPTVVVTSNSSPEVSVELTREQFDQMMARGTKSDDES